MKASEKDGRRREGAGALHRQAVAPGYGDERRALIARAVDEKGRASVGALARRFSVSTVTIRKDLAWLEGEQRLIRTHGGAVAAGRGRAEVAFETRQRLQRAEKLAIGAAAAELVQDGDSIALDASTTVLQMVRALRSRRELTIVTNGIRIATEFAALPGISVLMPGGRLRWEALSLVGSWGDALLPGANINTALVGTVGLTLETGLTDVTDEEAAIKRAMVEAARRVVVLADHTKWGRVAFATFCPIDRVDLVITDDAAPAAMVSALRARNVEVRMVSVAASQARAQ